MSIEVVVGANWGDEGKGRMVDYLAQNADFVVRFQGGNNAGHTVVNEHGTFKLHLLPSGVFNPRVTNILGPGMVIDLQGLVEELDNLKAKGFSPKILVSERATICFPFHRLEDGWEEERLGHKAYGSTRRGIAPAYGDRTTKKAVQLGELLYADHLREHLQHIVEWKKLKAQGIYGQGDCFTFEETWAWTQKYGARLLPLICDTSAVLEQAAEDGKNIVFEAQLGTLRDLNYGIYPYTTSSCALASYAPIGGGLFGHRSDRVIAVVKAFSTCVGEGPFVTRMDEDEANSLRETAQEYGAATGRPRTIGHFDALATRYGCWGQAATDVALTKLDSLSGLKTLKICSEYEYRGQRITRFPLNPVLQEATPVYQEMPGWTEDISGVRHFEDLPQAAQDYVLEIERLIRCPITYVSVGPEREALIHRPAASAPVPVP
ncbi:MAG: adenylosuccinate synthase [Candidatus Hydrogenedentes bacterium]|nr:adenylosuccinate synthase [Candidatus Hydrogenedentota bacterium]